MRADSANCQLPRLTDQQLQNHISRLTYRPPPPTVNDPFPICPSVKLTPEEINKVTERVYYQYRQCHEEALRKATEKQEKEWGRVSKVMSNDEVDDTVKRVYYESIEKREASGKDAKECLLFKNTKKVRNIPLQRFVEDMYVKGMQREKDKEQKLYEKYILPTEIKTIRISRKHADESAERLSARKNIMEDEAEAYLRFATKLKWRHFAQGHSSISEKRPAEKERIESSARQASFLPTKKRKRTGDSDSDSDGENGISLGLPFAAPSLVPSSLPSLPGETPRNRAKTTLMEKWFPGSTLKNATLDAAQAPSLDYTEVSVARINAAREHILLLRAGVEDVLAYASVSSDGDVLSGTDNWRWRELRDTLTQLTLRDAFRTKKRIVGAMKWLLATKALTVDIPKSPSLKQWHNYLNCNGPEQGCEPSQSLFVWLDSACTTALFTALVSQMLRAYKRGMRPVVNTRHNVQENQLESETDSNNDDDENKVNLPSQESEDENRQELDVENKQIDIIARLPALCGSSASEDVISLLSFLRVFMPVEVEDEFGNVVARTAGYGVWLYACLTAVDTPLEPDLDRLVHELFRACCRQIRTLGDVHGIHGDDRGAILNVFLPRGGDNIHCSRHYNTISDVKREDILAIHTIIIILAKLFRQNQNRLIPL